MVNTSFFFLGGSFGALWMQAFGKIYGRIEFQKLPIYSVPSFLGLWTYGHDFCLLDLQAYGILIDLKHGNLVLTLRVWDALDLDGHVSRRVEFW
ncbi:hypothetical protein RhiirA4_486570 [Rhizophagus irregularis]|uniref:Uncharacterized protein n=1 Tax=Rhizophagus irregularis TaxID=588596 RepID=A0A2I1HRS6_9GLOM|nr:hypothetical protein RhiirA4_486570 [Rhizophagus irregularis]